MSPIPLPTALPAATLSPEAPGEFPPGQPWEDALQRIARRADELVRASAPRARHLSDRWFWMKAEREVLGSASALAAYNLLRLCARWTQGPDLPPGHRCGA